MRLTLARQAAECGEVPVGAVLVDARGEVLAEGANAVIALNDPTAHAEVVALRAAAERVGNYRLPDSTLYVTLEPCAMCAGALVHARVKRVVFAVEDPKAGACGSVLNVARHDALNHRVEIERGLLEDEAAALLRTFFALRRPAPR